LFIEVCITRAKRYAEKHYIRETAQTPSAKPLYATENHAHLDVLPIFGTFNVVIINYG